MKQSIVLFAALAAALTAMTPARGAETYRLVHAIGNKETLIAKGLSQSDCQRMKKDRIKIAELLGIHSEALAIGSITCLAESLFDD